MSGVRGDARKRQSQPAPEVRMTEAERMAYLAGYEFALSHIHDEPVQADLALLSSDTTEAPGVRAVIEREVAKERAAWVAKIEALTKDWQRTSDEFAEGNGGWNKVMRYKDAAATLRALIPANAAADTEAGR